MANLLSWSIRTRFSNDPTDRLGDFAPLIRRSTKRLHPCGWAAQGTVDGKAPRPLQVSRRRR